MPYAGIMHYPLTLGLALFLSACAVDDGGDVSTLDHNHDVVDDTHTEPVRDPATLPCDADNWKSLLPDLRECALVGEHLDGESLRRANLTGADLSGASLVGAD